MTQLSTRQTHERRQAATSVCMFPKVVLFSSPDCFRTLDVSLESATRRILRAPPISCANYSARNALLNYEATDLSPLATRRQPVGRPADGDTRSPQRC